MKLINVKIEEVVQNEYNPNRMTPSEYKNVLYSLGKFGQLVPILTRPKNSEDRYIIIDGEHRWKAMKELGMNDIDIVIYEKQDDISGYKMITVALDQFHGKIDKELLKHIFKEQNKEVEEFLSKIKLDKLKIVGHDDIQVNFDWNNSQLFEESKNYKVPFTIITTDGEILNIKSIQKLFEDVSVELLQGLWQYCSKKEITEDEKIFLLFQLATRRALTVPFMAFKKNPERPISIVYRDKKENIKKVIDYIDKLH